MTPAAEAQIARLMARGGTKGLRIGVKKGGCAGMEYTMEYVDEIAPHDEVVEQNGARVMIAPMAQMFLFGTEIDYETGLIEFGLPLQQPQRHRRLRLRRVRSSSPTAEPLGRLPSRSRPLLAAARQHRHGESRMARRKLVAGNWKMNGLAASAAMLDELAAAQPAPACDVLICPPATLIARLAGGAVPGRRPGLPPGARPAPTPATSPPRCWPTPAPSR